MADILLAYPAATDATITIASLASDTNLLAGAESNSISNLTNKYLDYLISGKIRTGTSPTTARSIQVWAVASWDGTNWPDVFDGTASAETITSANHKNAICRLVAEMATDATSDRDYHFSGGSIRDLFGGTCPPAFVLFVTHNTAANLNSTAGNHQIRIQGVYETV
jgi:hypothetical protein